MPHPRLLAPLHSWLLSLGVGQSTAAQATQKIATRLEAGRGLRDEEQQLITAFFNRPNAARALDAQLRARVEQQKMFPESKAPGQGPRLPIPYPNISATPNSGKQGRTPAHTPEWRDPHPSDPGRASAKGHDLESRPTRATLGHAAQNAQSDLQFARRLAKRVGGH